MDLNLWAILHDGDMEGITGTLPGDVIFHVWLGWVAEEFPAASGLLTVILHGCTGIEYTEFGSSLPHVGIAELQGLDIEILSASQHGDWVEVINTLGVLRVRYAGVTVQLNDGTVVTLDQLTTAVNRAVEKWVASQRGTA